LNETNSNSLKIEMTLTIIPELYLMEKDPMAFRRKLVCGYPHDEPGTRGGEAGLHLFKWTLLVKMSLDTPCLQPEGHKRSYP
jgi:hypothetical protein